ncbi:MAG: threonine synthase [Woeseiaceae bacterium]
MNGYRCFSCATTQDMKFAGCLCPSCGGNLDITYDYEAVAGNIEQLRDGRAKYLFSYAPFLPVTKPHSPFPLRIGATPLYPAKRLGQSLGMRNLYLKDDTVNPSASSKDRASVIAVRRAIDIGADIVSVASTGNAGSSLACVAAAVGMQAIVFVPQTAPAAKLAQALSFGATVLAIRGNYDDAFDLCRIASDEFGWFNRSTGYNPFTREGKKICAYEIWESLDGRVPDRIVVPTGDGNLLSGMWKGWCDLKGVGLIKQLPKIDCVQSDASAAISNTVRRIRSGGSSRIDWRSVAVDEVKAATIADSIAVDRPRDGLAAVRAIIESGGETVTVTDEDILGAIPEMARLSGIFPEPAAAAPLAAVKQMVGNNTIESDELVVCLVSGSGLKDIGSAQKAAGKPLVIDPSIDAVRDVLAAS